MRFYVYFLYNMCYILDEIHFLLMSKSQSVESSPVKRLWGGLSSIVSNMKDKTLEFVDNLQDKIMDLDAQVQKSTENEDKDFDKTLLPILENASTYLIEPSEENYKQYESMFIYEEKKSEINSFLRNSQNLKHIHDRLVPSKISENVFWARLFYKLQSRSSPVKPTIQHDADPLDDDDLEGIDLDQEMTPEELEELKRIEEMSIDELDEELNRHLKN